MSTNLKPADTKKEGFGKLTPVQDPKLTPINTQCIMALELFTLLGNMVGNIEENVYDIYNNIHFLNLRNVLEGLSIPICTLSSLAFE